MSSTQFYSYDEDLHTNTSAQIIVSHIIELLNPKSVSDFGCGKGQFLKAFKNAGISSVHGYDGPWAKEPSRENLAEDEFSIVDFEHAERIHPQGTDVALSLEVAEHLNDAVAQDFVRLLCATSDVVVFSAALPSQGGQGHINEKPISYWSELFEQNEFVPFDLLRRTLWDNDDVEVWYRQNICLYAKSGTLQESRLQSATDCYLNEQRADIISHPRTLVHPSFYETRVNEYEQRLNLIYDGKIKPTSYLYLYAKSIVRKIKRGANE